MHAVGWFRTGRGSFVKLRGKLSILHPVFFFFGVAVNLFFRLAVDFFFIYFYSESTYFRQACGRRALQVDVVSGSHWRGPDMRAACFGCFSFLGPFLQLAMTLRSCVYH